MADIIIKKIACLFFLILLGLPGQGLSQTATISIDCANQINSVSPLLFGNNIEWAWNGDGIWDPTINNFSNTSKSLVNNIVAPLIRFPGGTLADKYRWKLGIGDPSIRGKNLDYDNNLQDSIFGTDEFSKLCQLKGAIGLITVNFGTGNPQDAADWVEYCNGSSTTFWGSSRAANGYVKPFGIKFWEIGNELYGNWEPGNCDIGTYTTEFIQYVQAMKEKDPTIQIGAVAMPDPYGIGSKDTTLEWNRTLLNTAGDNIDFLCVHTYGPGISSSGLCFYQNGSRIVSFSSSQDGNLKFTIQARGTPVDGIYPLMECQIDDQPAFETEVTSENWQTYSFVKPLSPGSHTLIISFLNDAYTPSQDRNLFINKIVMETSAGIQSLSLGDESELFKATMAYPNQVDWQLEEIQKLIQEVVPQRSGTLKIAVTEFNATYGLSADDLSKVSDLKSALFVADLLQVFLRRGIYLANCWSFSNNVSFGCIRIDPTIVKRPTYYVFDLLARHANRRLLATVCTSPTFSSDLLGNSPTFQSIPYLSQICTVDAAKAALYLSVINKHDTQPIEANILIGNFRPQSVGTVYTFTGLTTDANNETNPNAVIYTTTSISSVSTNFVYQFPPHSLTFMVLKR